jgi:hypothetical protein
VNKKERYATEANAGRSGVHLIHGMHTW